MPTGSHEVVVQKNEKISEALNYAVSQHKSGKIEKALLSYLLILSEFPERIDLLLNVGAALHDLARYRDAADAYKLALESNPDWWQVLYNLGNTYMSLDLYADAIDCYDRCILTNTAHTEAIVTKGTALESMGEYESAFDLYEKALSINPASAEAHWNKSLALLRIGRFSEGWSEFEWRWKKKGYTTTFREFHCPQWDGRRLNGETVLIYAEQAFGDTIQFSRYLTLVAARGAKVVVEVPEQLTELICSVKDVTLASSTASSFTQFQYYAPLLSLPFILGPGVGIPNSVPYLTVSKDRVDYWSQRVTQDNSLKVGLVWAGRKTPDPHRTCGLKILGFLAHEIGVTFYSLQVDAQDAHCNELPVGMKILDFTKDIKDFADTAALIECIDLVITIDTATAHLAGSLGKATFVMLPFNSDWRWMLDRSDSPWYPGMRLFRQKKIDDWVGVMCEVKCALTGMKSSFVKSGRL